MNKHISLLLTGLILLSRSTFAQTGADNKDSVRSHALQNVYVTAHNSNQKQFIQSTQMGKTEIPMSMLTKAPTLAGEPDIIKALQLTPGVKKGVEGGIGMYVRGGGNDENLVLLDGAPVYNSGHLLGFFSVFNTAAIRDVQLYKSSFPSQYGGRLSSVLDVRTKDGSFSEYKAKASIGIISSSFSVQGPILKDKLSFILSARRTYIDQVLKYIPYHFSDINGKVAYIINENNRLYFSAYTGSDVLATHSPNKDTASTQVKSGMKLGNQVMTLRWNNLPVDKKHSSDVTVLYTKFNYNVNGNMASNSVSMSSAINDIGVKADYKNYENANHTVSTGLSLTHHFFNPNIVNTTGDMLDRFGNRDGQKIYSDEAGAYINDDYRINDKWQVNGGLRLSGAVVKGKVYANLEPRLAARYLIDERNSVKVSYARMAQYMHLVSSSSVVLPTDLWYPVTANVKPGVSDQVSAGYYHSIPEHGISISAEAYYKWQQHLVEYREGALLILNDNYEKELVTGKGHTYGLELFVSKTSGKFTGWAGYTLSYAVRQFDSLNKGKEYYSRFDRRHDFSLVGMYELNKRWSFNCNVVYATGSPFTGQKSQYVIPKADLTGFEALPAYTDRNALRMSAAFRVDLGAQYKFKLGKRVNGDANLSVYNVMNRTQPGTVQRTFDEKTSSYKYTQRGLFGMIPALSINLNF